MGNINTNIQSWQIQDTSKYKDIKLDGLIDCTIENLGAFTVTLNNSIRLATGETIEFSCNSGEVLTGSLKANFGGNTGNLMIVTRKAN